MVGKVFAPPLPSIGSAQQNVGQIRVGMGSLGTQAEFIPGVITIKYADFGADWRRYLIDISRHIHNVAGHQLYLQRSEQETEYSKELRIISDRPNQNRQEFCNLPFLDGTVEGHRIMEGVEHLYVPDFCYSEQYGSTDPMYQMFQRFETLKVITCRRGAAAEPEPIPRSDYLVNGHLAPKVPPEADVIKQKAFFIASRVFGEKERAFCLDAENMQFMAHYLTNPPGPQENESVSLVLNLPEEAFGELPRRDDANYPWGPARVVLQQGLANLPVHRNLAINRVRVLRLREEINLGDDQVERVANFIANFLPFFEHCNFVDLTYGGSEPLINALRTKISENPQLQGRVKVIDSGQNNEAIKAVFRRELLARKLQLLPYRRELSFPTEENEVLKQLLGIVRRQGNLPAETDPVIDLLVGIIERKPGYECFELDTSENRLRLKVKQSPQGAAALDPSLRLGFEQLLGKLLSTDGFELNPAGLVRVDESELSDIVRLFIGVVERKPGFECFEFDMTENHLSLRLKQVPSDGRVYTLDPSFQIGLKCLLIKLISSEKVAGIRPDTENAPRIATLLIAVLLRKQGHEHFSFQTDENFRLFLKGTLANLSPSDLEETLKPGLSVLIRYAVGSQGAGPAPLEALVVNLVSSKIEDFARHIGLHSDDWIGRGERTLRLAALRGLAKLLNSKWSPEKQMIKEDRLHRFFHTAFSVSVDASLASLRVSLSALVDMKRLASVRVTGIELEAVLRDLSRAAENNPEDFKSATFIEVICKQPGSNPKQELVRLVKAIDALRGVNIQGLEASQVRQKQLGPIAEHPNVVIFAEDDATRTKTQASIMRNIVFGQIASPKDIAYLMQNVKAGAKISAKFLLGGDATFTIAKLITRLGLKADCLEISGMCLDGTQVSFKDLVECLNQNHAGACFPSVRFLRLIDFSEINPESIKAISGGYKLFPNLEIFDCRGSTFNKLAEGSPLEDSYLPNNVAVVTDSRESLEVINQKTVAFMRKHESANRQVPHLVGSINLQLLDECQFVSRGYATLQSLTGDALTQRLGELLNKYPNLHTFDISGFNVYAKTLAAIINALPERNNECSLILRDFGYAAGLRGDQFKKLLASVIQKGYRRLDLRSVEYGLRDLGYMLGVYKAQSDQITRPVGYIKGLMTKLMQIRDADNDYTAWFSSRPLEANGPTLRSWQKKEVLSSAENDADFIQGFYTTKNPMEITFWTQSGAKKVYHVTMDNNRISEVIDGPTP
jgi:hypothetical protein